LTINKSIYIFLNDLLICLKNRVLNQLRTFSFDCEFVASSQFLFFSWMTHASLRSIHVL